MRNWIYLLMIGALSIVVSDRRENIVGAAVAPPPSMGFFVTSAKSKTGNLGGLAGADKTCQSLAAAVGQGEKTWRAYLSAERDPANNNNPTNARDRIGAGPWFNANGVMVGNDLADLHARRGNPILLVDEHGQMIPGNWPKSPKPTEHDILTGSTAEGTVMPGKTCESWTSDSSTLQAQIGHHGGIGLGGNTAGASASWNSAHESQSCATTAPRGGAGRFYCFAAK
ncbi:MAG TPA: hypothetical protein VMT22_03025 [Terriglobales bacterium]|jgi:hypothetical protein|nr:hypothetical protein [Terriglobales bacterium]